MIIKKKLSIFLTLTLVFTLLVSPICYGSEIYNNNMNEPSSSVSGVLQEMTRDQKIAEMTNNGVSKEDAIFILDLDQKLNNTKNKIIIGDDTPNLSDSEMKNKVNFQSKCLALDPAALKKALTAKALTQGMTDLKSLIAEQGPKDNYKIEYPDGSWIKASGTLIRLDKPNPDGVTPNSQSIVDSGTLNADGTYQLTYELTEYNGASYSKNKIQTTFTASGINAQSGTLTMHFTGKQGSQSAWGIITLGNAYTYYYPDSATSTGYWSGGRRNSNGYADAVNQVIYTCSGSIGLTGAIAITVGGSWTQNAIIRLYGNGIWNKIAEVYA
jgi:hypothetical protein